MRMVHAIRNGRPGVLLLQDRVHGLEEEVVEGQIREAFRQGQGLWINQLQLVAPGEHDFRIRLGADADPVQSIRCGLGAVGVSTAISKP